MMTPLAVVVVVAMKEARKGMQEEGCVANELRRKSADGRKWRNNSMC